MASEVAFRQLFCRSAGCGEMFYICRPCYRRQAYCSEKCRRETRRQQQQKANRRYQEDPEVRQDHRDRQREYRKRLGESRVTDQSSTIECGGVSISVPLAEGEPESSSSEGLHDTSKARRRERCSCGR